LLSNISKAKKQEQNGNQNLDPSAQKQDGIVQKEKEDDPHDEGGSGVDIYAYPYLTDDDPYDDDGYEDPAMHA